MNIPNLISIIRIGGAPVLIILGVVKKPDVFILLFAALLISDFLDGFLARKLKERTRLGTQLDTIGDVLTILCVLIGAWMLWPQRLAAEIPYLGTMLICLAFSALLSLIRFKHLPSYHTWASKFSTTIAGVGGWFLFANITHWVFRIAMIVMVYSSIESMLITSVLPRWKTNIHSLMHALKIKRES